LGADFSELIFTSGGTESAALAILGAALAQESRRRRKVILAAAEHHCVLNTRLSLNHLGYEVQIAPVDRHARIRLDVLSSWLQAGDVLIVAAMHANNELGTLNPVIEIAELCRRQGTLFFCDAVQTFGKTDNKVTELGADLVSASAHKIGGPKGCGALYVRAGTPLKPLNAGGGQERELRGGTENVAAICGFAEATMLANSRTDQTGTALLANQLCDALNEMGFEASVPPTIPKLPGHAHVRRPGMSAESLIIILDRLGVSAGTGAACSSGSVEPSHVMLACGWTLEQAKEGIRFTLGASTTQNEIKFAVSCIRAAAAQISQSSSTGT
jgi:cysteine desulfurase